MEAVVADSEIPGDLQTVDLCGCTLAPGFVDLQVNGAGGFDVMSADPEARMRTMPASRSRATC